jgi:DNA invertase Pin-like site-specific DNA recombinase
MRRPSSTPRYAVGLYRVSTAEQGQSGLGLEAQQASVHAFVTAGPRLDVGRRALRHR